MHVLLLVCDEMQCLQSCFEVVLGYIYALSEVRFHSAILPDILSIVSELKYILFILYVLRFSLLKSFIEKY